MPFTINSALEPRVQFLHGYDENDRIGLYKAPSTEQVEGTVVFLSTDGETLAVSENNNGQFILEQPCAANGPIGSAANREKYLQGIPQRAVACGTNISVYPVKSGAIIYTNVVATGSETGAITGDTVTPGSTEVEDYQGKWRVLQTGNTPKGVILSEPDSNNGVKILLYGI